MSVENPQNLAEFKQWRELLEDRRKAPADEQLKNLASWPGVIGPPANLVVDAYLQKIQELGIEGTLPNLQGYRICDAQWLAQIAKRLESK